jgi:hypothetical protein
VQVTQEVKVMKIEMPNYLHLGESTIGSMIIAILLATRAPCRLAEVLKVVHNNGIRKCGMLWLLQGDRYSTPSATGEEIAYGRGVLQ